MFCFLRETKRSHSGIIYLFTKVPSSILLRISANRFCTIFSPLHLQDESVPSKAPLLSHHNTRLVFLHLNQRRPQIHSLQPMAWGHTHVGLVRHAESTNTLSTLFEELPSESQEPLECVTGLLTGLFGGPTTFQPSTTCSISSSFLSSCLIFLFFSFISSFCEGYHSLQTRGSRTWSVKYVIV